MTSHTVAVILAGGTGERVGLGIPKQLLKISGRPVIEHTLRVFEESPEIDQILVLMTPGYVAAVERLVADGGFTKVSTVLEGGASRTETTRRAIEALGTADPYAKVLFHDAVRPFVDQRIISECVTALDDYQAVDVAIASADTIVRVDDFHGEVIREIPARDRLRRGQTPQAFRLATIRQAYERAMADPDFTGGKVTATDDCGVVLRYLPHVPIAVVAGSESNIKITHPVDVFLADRLFQLAASTVTPGRARLDGKVAVVFGGSYGIGAELAGLCRDLGAEVECFSRSTTGTYVENPEHVAMALATAYDRHGRIDYVVNTAGVLQRGLLADADEAAIAEAVTVNYLAPVHIARAAFPYLREGGQLLLYTSSSYTRGRAGYSLYSSAKAAVVNLTQALADEWAEYGIGVNCVNPERTATPMRERAFGEEPPGTLLSAHAVAQTSLDVLLSGYTGHIVDVRLNAGRLVGEPS
jgi:2-C-methyl-D-erythritol 4-phosphate cytidylyltransferase